MTANITLRSAAAVLVAAGLLAGCGGGSDDDGAAKSDTPASTQAQGPASTTATPQQLAANIKAGPKPKASSPERRWARSLCQNMAKASTPVKQPQSNSSDVVKAQRSLVRFFGQVEAQLGAQQQVMKAAGDPPIKGAEAEWQRAVGGMDTVRQQLQTIEKKLSSADLNSPQDLQNYMKSLGGQMQILTNYQNPIASLSSNPTVGPALAGEKSCARFS